MEKLLTYFGSERGRQVKLARHLGITSSAISQWMSVPVHSVRKISKFTGISKEELRPDIYGEDDE